MPDIPKKKKKENRTPKPSLQWLFAFKNIYTIITKSEIWKAIQTSVNGSPPISVMKIWLWFAEFVNEKSVLYAVPFTWTNLIPGTWVTLPSPRSAQTVLSIAVAFWFKIKSFLWFWGPLVSLPFHHRVFSHSWFPQIFIQLLLFFCTALQHIIHFPLCLKFSCVHHASSLHSKYSYKTQNSTQGF